MISILLGTFLYQIFTSIIPNKIFFSLVVIEKTSIYFWNICSLLLNCIRKIKKIKVYHFLICPQAIFIPELPLG